MSTNNSSRGYVGQSYNNGKHLFSLPDELIIDPDEPDWDYDMAHAAASAMKQLDRIERMRSWGETKRRALSSNIIPCGSDTASCAQINTRYVTEESSLLRRSGGAPNRKSTNMRNMKMSKKKGGDVVSADDVNPYSTPLLPDAEYSSSHKFPKDSSKKLLFQVTMPKMEPTWGMDQLEAETCTGIDSLYPLTRGFRHNPRDDSPDKPNYSCSRLVPDDYDNAPHDAETIVSTGSGQSRSSPTSVTHMSSILSDYSADSGIRELQRELESLKRFSTLSSPIIPEESRCVVHFAHPLVTAVKQRPKTLPEEVSELFFDQDELIMLHEEREAQIFEEQVECIAMPSESNDELSISVSFPITRVLPKQHNTGAIYHEPDICPAVEVQALPKTCKEI